MLPSTPLYLEGAPSHEERVQEEAEAAAARATWKPSPEAYVLLDRLRGAVSRQIVAQLWDPIMFWCEDEGPHPMRARCVDVLIHDDHEGHPRAYLVLEDVDVVKTPDGLDASGWLVRQGRRSLLGVHYLHELTVE